MPNIRDQRVGKCFLVNTNEFLNFEWFFAIGADAIIRQHKAACLRVTSLLICKDLLWVGTSAGVILTNPLPSITASTSVLRNIGPTGSPHGHTGHVRFLTSVEVPKGSFHAVDYENSRISPSPSNNRIKRNNNNISELDSNDVTTTLVVSGGDGYEDFRYNQQSEAVGRDDSTNHLLIWRVWYHVQTSHIKII